MKRIEKRVARAATSDRAPKAVAAVVLSGSILGGAENFQVVSLTAAALAVAEMARSRFGVKGLRRSDTCTQDNKLGSRVTPVAGRTP